MIQTHSTSIRFPGRFVAVILFSIALVMTSCSGLNPGGGNAVDLNNGVPNVLDNLPPTPVFPPETIGAYVSNQTPADGDNINVYVILRGHDYSTPKPPTPLVGVPVTISGQFQPVQPTSSPMTVNTERDGMAKFIIKVSGRPGLPQVINVSARVNNKTITTTTFFAVMPPPYLSPTPDPNATPSPGPSPTP
jgi:hypothetical protein